MNEVPLGHWRIQAGLSLRQAMLVNGILFNSEAWQGTDTKDILILEKVDEALLRGLLGAHTKIPLEALYLETKSVPIRFIVASRRILYLHTILQRNPCEMLPKIYQAQKINPSPGDFVNLVQNDLEILGLNISEHEMKQTTKSKLKKIVKEKVHNAAFQYLKSLQQSHSKMSNVKYEKFDISQYLCSPLFNRDSRGLLLALRTRTVRGIKCDFPGLYKDKMCPLGCGDLDTIQNILSCKILRQYHTSENIVSGDINFEDIFSHDVSKQKQVTNLYENLLQIRNNLLNSPPVACTGPLQSMHALQNQSLVLGI